MGRQYCRATARGYLVELTTADLCTLGSIEPDQSNGGEQIFVQVHGFAKLTTCKLLRRFRTCRQEAFGIAPRPCFDLKQSDKRPCAGHGGSANSPNAPRPRNASNRKKKQIQHQAERLNRHQVDHQVSASPAIQGDCQKCSRHAASIDCIIMATVHELDLGRWRRSK